MINRLGYWCNTRCTVTCKKVSDKFGFCYIFGKKNIFSKQHSLVIFASILMK